MMNSAEHARPASRRQWLAPLLVTLPCVAGLLAYRLPHLRDALFGDEAFTLLKAALFKSGGLPYRDLWDHHPPGLALLLALLPMRLLRAEAAVRLVSVATLGATVFLLADLLRRAGMSFAALLAGAAVFTIFHCLDWNMAYYLETEQVMALTLTLMVWCLWTRKPPAWAWFFWGLTTAFKQSTVVFFPLLLLLDLGDRERRGSCTTRGVLLRAFAAASVWLAISAYFALRGAFPVLFQEVVLDALRRRNEAVSGYCAPWIRWALCRDYQVLAIAIAASALAGAGRLPGSAASRRIFIPGLAWLISGFAYLWLQKCGLPYYYGLTTPGLMWLTAWAVDGNITLLLGAGAGLRRTIHGLLLLLLALGVAVQAGRLLDNRVPSGLPSTFYAHNSRWLARKLKADLREPCQVLAVQDYPGWYWYLEQPPPRVAWLPYYLHAFPERRAQLVAEAARYGRGKRLLLIYYLAPEMYPPDVAQFRELTRAGGAREASLTELLGATDLPPGYAADVWDLRDCETAAGRCAPAAGAGS